MNKCVTFENDDNDDENGDDNVDDKRKAAMRMMKIITRHAHWQDVHCKPRSLAGSLLLGLRLQWEESASIRDDLPPE